MDFRISEEIQQKSGLSYDMIFYLASLYFYHPITSSTIEEAIKKGYVIGGFKDNHNMPVAPEILQSGVNIIEQIFLDSDFKDTIDSNGLDRYDKLADKLREIYPQGRKEGTAYMWRDSRAIISKKLKTLVKKFSFQFTDEQAIEATKKYVESFNGDYSFMQLLKYFILKRNNETGEEVSQLMSYIENEDCTDAANNSWMDTVR